MKSNKDKASYYFKVEWKLLIFVFLSGMLFDVFQVFGPIKLGEVMSKINNNDPVNEIIIAVLIYFITILSVQIARFFKRYTVRVFANRTTRRMRIIMYQKTLGMDLNTLKSNSLGDTLTRCVGDVMLSSEGFRKLLTEIFDTGVLMGVYFITLIIYDYKLTLIGCLFIPIAMLCAYLLKSIIIRYNKEYRNYMSKISEDTFNLIDNAVEYREYDSIDNQINEYNSKLNKLKHLGIKANLYENSMPPVYKAISMVGVVFVIVMGANNCFINKPFMNKVWDIGIFYAYMNLFINFTIKASKAGKLVNAVEKAKVSFRRIKPYLKEEETDESNTNLDIENTGLLTVDNLCFGYNDKCYGPLSFYAHKGEIIGITGQIASGKTALGLTFIGLLDYDGSILFNNIELKDYSKNNRSNFISYLGHDYELIDDTIYHNIAFNENIDINEVIKHVCLDKDFETFKDGINTSIGNQGQRLSGGQMQRLALARALVQKKELIVLDDPFSACDEKVESEIVNNLRTYYKDSIIIIISHRIKSFSLYNKIIMLDEKPVCASHEAMQELSQTYKKIYLSQKGDN